MKREENLIPSPSRKSKEVKFLKNLAPPLVVAAFLVLSPGELAINPIPTPF